MQGESFVVREIKYFHPLPATMRRGATLWNMKVLVNYKHRENETKVLCLLLINEHFIK